MEDNPYSFEAESQKKRRGLLRETFDWLGQNKKWWLLPIVLAILGLGALVVLGGSSAISPFIYTLF
ncbi:MAG: hypothetical protein CMJ83_14565 [Planctomycetes bacterium]|nr:hypothetical protein [Planctomycetota bacterium]